MHLASPTSPAQVSRAYRYRMSLRQEFFSILPDFPSICDREMNKREEL